MKGKVIFGAFLLIVAGGIVLAAAPTEVAKLKAADAAFFGVSVDIDDAISVIGDPLDDESGSDSGSAYIFGRDGVAWSEIAKLKASDGEPGDNFGISVAVNNTTILIGAPYKNQGAGAAYLFAPDSSGRYVQRQKLSAPDGAQGDYFGCSVALDGGTALIGACGNDDRGEDSGSVYVFVEDSFDDWLPQTMITASDGFAGQKFGTAMAIDGSVAVIGGPGGDGSAAYVMQLASTGVWTEKQKLVPSPNPQCNLGGAEYAEVYTNFGESVDIDGALIVVGQQADYEFGCEAAAYVFLRGADGVWSEQAILWGSDSNLSPGHAVAISEPEKVVFMGTTDNVADDWDFEGNLHDVGAVYMFDLDSSGRWSQQARLIHKDFHSADRLGGSAMFTGSAPRFVFRPRGVAFDNGRLLVGAPGDTDRDDIWGLPSPPDVSGQGSAYIFSFVDVYQESAGVVSIEAESFASSSARDPYFWQIVDMPGASTDKAIQAVPDDSMSITKEILATSPRVDYHFNSSTVGSYTVWARMQRSDVFSESTYLGIDGTIIDSFRVPWPGWAWLQSRPVELAAGQHTISFFMQDTGVYVDKFVLTTSNSPPIGQGPAVSELGPGGNNSPAVQISTFGFYDMSPEFMPTAGANDIEDADISQSVRWHSSIDGELPGIGAWSSRFILSEGTHIITASATDSLGRTGSDVVQIVVGSSSQNTDPEVTIHSPTNGQSFEEGSAVYLDALAMDLQDGDLTRSLAWQSDQDGFLASGSDFTVTTLSSGAHTITASVIDSGGATGSSSVSITVEATNGPPSFTSIPIKESTQGVAYTYDVMTNDPDMDAVSVSALVLPVWLTFIDNGDGTASLAGTPTNDDVGDNPVQLEVTDGMLADVQSFVITVANVNDVPEFTSTAITSAMEGMQYNYVIAVTDIDRDNLKITGTIPAWLTLTDNRNGTGSLTGTPSGAEVGDHAVELLADDGNSGIAIQSFMITVVAAGEGPTITLLGDALVTINVGDTYIDAGATASDPQDDDLTAQIVVDNPVDTSTSGVYTVTYTVEDSVGNRAQAQRIVIVDGPPIITLIGTATVTLTEGDTYTDAGARAIDREDGDLTDEIVITNPVNTSIPGMYTVTYTVRDSVGNEAQAQRTVIVQVAPPPPPPPPPPPVDEPPTITLNGDATVRLTEGDTYTDEGATASDPEDGDLTDRIVVNNPVDTRTAGTYTVTYTVKDSGGNEAQAERTVIVEAAPPPPPPPRTDGGGSGGGTVSPLELLASVLMLLAIGRRQRMSALGR